MCVEAMDGNMKKEVFPSCWVSRAATNMSHRKHPPFNPEEEAFKPWRPDGGKATARKDFRHEQKRRKLSRKKGLLIDSDKKMGANAMKRKGERFPEEPRPQGAMAPGNTTQYLMDVVYNDLPETSVMYRAHTASCEKYLCIYSSRSPRNACVSYEDDYESSLDFQQAEFEEAFRHFGSH